MKSISRKVFYLIFLVLFLLAGCGEDESPKKVDVYIAGRIDRSQAVYWKNGEMTYLTDGAQRSYVFSVTASGKDFYFAGGVEDGNGRLIPVYWKNGTAVQLSDGSKQAQVYSIAVSGSDVYVGGFESTNGTLRAIIWKNGVGSVLPLQTESTFSTVLDVTLGGSDVYAIGVESKLGNVFAKYWKNGIEVSLGINAAQYPYAYLSDIEVSGNDVHIVGHVFNSNGTRIPRYWKNGSEIAITNMIPSIIKVVNSDVYIVDESARLYMKNGTEARLPASELQGSFQTSGFAVKNGDVYVTAIRLDANNRRIGSYIWKNGVEQAPLLGSKLDTDFVGLALVDQ